MVMSCCNRDSEDKAGAYVPPCVGKDHAYYVTVKAVDGDKVLATKVLELGKY